MRDRSDLDDLLARIDELDTEPAPALEQIEQQAAALLASEPEPGGFTEPAPPGLWRRVIDKIRR
jgi:hypothetical protein